MLVSRTLGHSIWGTWTLGYLMALILHDTTVQELMPLGKDNKLRDIFRRTGKMRYIAQTCAFHAP